MGFEVKKMEDVYKRQVRHYPRGWEPLQTSDVRDHIDSGGNGDGEAAVDAA